jgi:hypothetical protein
VNRVRNERYELTKKEIESACNINVITYIPEDARIPEAIAKGTPVVDIHPYSSASIAFNRLSAALIGQTYEPNTFIYRLMKMIGFAKEDFVKIPMRSEANRFSKKKKPLKIVKIEDEEAEEENGDEKDEENEEIRDVKKLRREVDESVKSPAKSEIKSDIRKRLAMKIKEKLRERGIEE